MSKQLFFILVAFVAAVVVVCPAYGQSYDIRGQWVGNAQGTIFGAEGSVFITKQKGEDIEGIVEGGNFFGKAKFEIIGKVRGNYIFGQKEGHTFQGYLYPDGAIRGLFRAVDGEKFQVFLRRPAMYWGAAPQQPGLW
jgi:hypothetical protein